MDEFLDNITKKIPIIKMVEEKTNIKRKYLFYFSLLFSYMSIFTMFGINMLTNFIGLLYPAYKSFKSLQTKDKDDDSQWLTYWIVFSFSNLLLSNN